MAFKRNNNVIDSPGNSFATLNPLDTGSSVSITKGNLLASSTSELVDFTITRATMVFPKTGIYYFECRFISSSNGGWFGIDNAYGRITGNQNGWNNGTASIGRNGNGDFYLSSDASSIGTETHNTSGEVIPVVWDADEKKLYTHQGKPSSIQLSDYNYSGAISVVSGNFFPIVGSRYTATDSYLNFGQDHTFGGAKTDSAGPYSDASGLGSFYYEPPPGALALCTANLPSFDGNPQEHFRAVTYVGNGTAGHRINDIGFKPDLVWLKDRGRSETFHQVYDSVRGEGKVIFSNDTLNEYDRADGLTSFNYNGFSLGSHSHNNGDGERFIAWCWKAGGGGGKYNIDGKPYADFADTGLTAGDGIITPDGMSVNTKTGFSIVKYEGNSTDGDAVPTGISNPAFFILKNISTQTSNSVSTLWVVGLKGVTSSNEIVYLNEPFSLSSNYNGEGHTLNDDNIQLHSASGTEPFLRSNKSGDNYIMYCWKAVPGYSAFGSYDGTDSTDGPFIYTGFKPAFLMIKRTDADQHWPIVDSTRNAHNPTDLRVYANLADPDDTGIPNFVDLLPNGFKCRNTNISYNVSGGKYIYMAFAEHSM